MKKLMDGLFYMFLAFFITVIGVHILPAIEATSSKLITTALVIDILFLSVYCTLKGMSITHGWGEK